MESIVTRFFIRREHNNHTSNTWILPRPECNHSVGNTRIPFAGVQTDDIGESLSAFH
jgi:hypothetical protein